MPVHVVIKGPAKSAKRAAARHGVPITKCKLLKRWDEVTCEAPCSAQSAVMRWYGDQPGVVTRGRRGFAPGTMLYFNTKCGTSLGGARRRRRKR